MLHAQFTWLYAKQLNLMWNIILTCKIIEAFLLGECKNQTGQNYYTKFIEFQGKT